MFKCCVLRKREREIAALDRAFDALIPGVEDAKTKQYSTKKEIRFREQRKKSKSVHAEIHSQFYAEVIRLYVRHQ